MEDLPDITLEQSGAKESVSEQLDGENMMFYCFSCRFEGADTLFLCLRPLLFLPFLRSQQSQDDRHLFCGTWVKIFPPRGEKEAKFFYPIWYGRFCHSPRGGRNSMVVQP